MRRRGTSDDQRLTIYLPDGAVAGRVVRFTPTGVEACVEQDVPRDESFPFTLHLQGAVISGRMSSVGQDVDVCRLQFSALTERDRTLLAPFLDPDA